MNTTHTAYIVDDDPVVRDALQLLLRQEDIAVELFESAEAFLQGYQPEFRGCAIVDIRMSGMDGLQLQEELNKRGIRLPIIFLTGHGDIPMSVRAMKAGAVDFLTKPVTGKLLLQSIRASFQECDRRLAQRAGNGEARSSLDNLTEREREVMTLAAIGHSNKEIARRLGISHRTVEIHKAHVMHKTGASNLLELARIARESGLID